MAPRMELMTVREFQSNGETKKSWTKIGMAWPLQNGGYRLQFDAMPIPTNDQNGNVQVSCLMMEPKPREDNRPRQETRKPTSGGGPATASVDLDDDFDSVPF